MTGPLVTAGELVRLLQGRDDVVVLDVSFALGRPQWGRQQYEAGHVPGAHFVDVETELSGAVRPDGRGGRHPLPEREDLQTVLRRRGVGQDSLVVAVDDGSMLAAGRLWWLLRHHGHEQVCALDGGMRAWRAAELPQEDSQPVAIPGDIVLAEGRMPVVEADEIPSRLASGRRLFDVRAAERHRGEVEPIDPVAGHIPGARNLPAATLMAPQGGFLPAEELRARLEPVRPGDMLSCGSGLTASQVAVACASAGVEQVVVYPGSWSDWIADPARGVETTEV